MQKNFRRLQKAVGERHRPRNRFVRDRDFLTQVAGALYELNAFHVKRLNAQILERSSSIDGEGNRVGLPTEDEANFLASCEDYRKELEQWLDAK